MLQPVITKETFQFLKALKENNNREWFAEHKEEFKREEAKVKEVYAAIGNALSFHDEIERFKMFRIYRDIRFSKNKIPYKEHLSGFYSRAGLHRRGGYYIQVQPGGSFIGVGFWKPEKQDLERLRKEWELDASELIAVMENKEFKEIWGALEGDELKTAPKGFDKEDPNIEFIRKKQFVFRRNFTDKEVLAPDFVERVNESFKAIRPFFDLMSSILTTNLNGESLLD